MARNGTLSGVVAIISLVFTILTRLNPWVVPLYGLVRRCFRTSLSLVASTMGIELDQLRTAGNIPGPVTTADHDAFISHLKMLETLNSAATAIVRLRPEDQLTNDLLRRLEMMSSHASM